MADALASRDDLVRQADRHQRQGRTDLAIEVYERLAQQTPTDWNVVKQLADLSERAGQREAAASRFLQLADHYFEEGFHPRASALYRKVLKLDPESDRALCQLAEIALQLQLKVDARQALSQVLALRRRRGDAEGAGAIAARLAEIEGPPAGRAAAEPDQVETPAEIAEAPEPVLEAEEPPRADDAPALMSPPDDVSRQAPPVAEAEARAEASQSLAERLRTLADDAVMRGDLGSAKRAWTAVLHVEPDDRAVRLQLLAAAVAEGDGAAAVTFAEGLEDGSAETLAWRFRAARLAGRGDDAALVSSSLQHGDTALAIEVRDLLRAADREAADAWTVRAVHALSAHAAPAALAAFADDLRADSNNDESAAGRDPLGADNQLLTADREARDAHVEPSAPSSEPLAVDADALTADADTLVTDADPLAADTEPLAADGASLTAEDHLPDVEPDVAFAWTDTADADATSSTTALDDAFGDAPAAGSLDAWLLDAMAPQEPPAAAPSTPADAATSPPEPSFDWGALLGRDVTPAYEPAPPAPPAPPAAAAEVTPPLAPPAAAAEVTPPPAPQPVLEPQPSADVQLEEAALDWLAVPPPADADKAPAPAPVEPATADSGEVPSPEPTTAVASTSDEIDLTALLDELVAATGPLPTPTLRSVDIPAETAAEAAPDAEDGEAERTQATQQVAAGRVFAAAGLVAEAARAFERASRDVRTRFEAAAALGDLHRSRGQLAEAVRWYDVAAEAPAPDATARRPVLYDLAETLETVGAADRALAVLLDLLSEVEDYRDARARADRLLRVDAGG